MDPVNSTHAVFDVATGELLFRAPEELCPSDKGKVALPAGFSDDLYAWSKSARQYQLVVGALEAKLVAQVKLIAERLSMQVISAGGSKKKKYASKEREVANWYALGAIGAATNVLLAAFNLLPADVKTRQFRYAVAEAAKRGGTVADAILRFKNGMDVAEAECARLEAIEQDAVARIKVASTGTAKQSAFNATQWDVAADRMQAAMATSAF